jgi:hypothetical protein
MGVALLLNSSDLGVLLGDPTAPGTVSLSLILFMHFFIFIFKIPYKAVVLTAIGVTFLGKKRMKN